MNLFYTLFNYLKWTLPVFKLLFKKQSVLIPVKTKNKPTSRFTYYMRGLVLIMFALSFTPATAQISASNGFSISTGAYSASGFGVNPYVAFRYNHYLSKGHHFIEGTFGVSSLESDVLKTFTNAKLFENDRLIAYEIVYGYDSQLWSSIPYFTAGVVGLNQGGQSKFGFVLGIGNRIYFESIFGSKNIGLRYDIRDHIISQSFNEQKSFIAHNLIFTLNLEFFY